LAVHREATVDTAVIILHAPCGPTAIFWTVVTVVINAINRVSDGWAFSHIGQENFKRCSPLVAYGDATTSVVLVTFVFFVFASANDACPSGVLDGPIGTVSNEIVNVMVWVEEPI
jgi:hypothetical protein